MPIIRSIIKKYFTKKQQPIESRWAGKKVNFLGDSITSGTAKRNFVTYVTTVNQSLKLGTARNYGISGGTIASRDHLYPGEGLDDRLPPVVSRWQMMNTDADIVFMLIGTNDYAAQIPIGDRDSTLISDFNGAFNIVLSGLKAKFPNAVIVVSTLLNRVPKPTRTHPLTIDKYNNAILDRCKEHAITCFHLHEVTDLNLETDYMQGLFQLTADGLHPGKEGSAILGRRIAEFINSNQKS